MKHQAKDELEEAWSWFVVVWLSVAVTVLALAIVGLGALAGWWITTMK